MIRTNLAAEVIGNGSALPSLLPSAGAPDWHHRWIASQVAGSDGDSITRWPDLTPCRPPADMLMWLPATATAPVLATDGGVKCLDFTNGNNEMVVQTGVGRRIRSMAIVFRLLTPNVSASIVFDNSGVFPSDLFAEQVAGPNLSIGWQGSGSQLISTSALTSWSLLVLRMGAGYNDLSTAYLNGVAATSQATGPGSGLNAFQIGNRYSTTGHLHVAEVITWPTLLDAAQAAAVHTAMKATYSVLP